MGLESVYREAMTLNTIEDMAQREAAARVFFENQFPELRSKAR